MPQIPLRLHTTYSILCQISSSHSGAVEDSSFLACDAVSTGK